MTTAQPGQEQRMENARDMLIRRRKDAESLGGSTEITTEELDAAIAALTRPTADLGEDGAFAACLRGWQGHMPEGLKRDLAKAADRIEELARALLSRSGDD